MDEADRVEAPRAPNPLCAGCNHPRTMHGSPPGKCKAIGCAKCPGYTPRST